MATVQHLRSASRPTFDRLPSGRILVWTECGIQVDAAIVDNCSANCLDCKGVADGLDGKHCVWCGEPIDQERLDRYVRTARDYEQRYCSIGCFDVHSGECDHR